MSTPFSIQAPEQIAKEYAGDKQRIMQAAQMGIVDPTAAVLAGMFIDRMRAPQPQAGNAPTIAQQVMAGAPPAGLAPPPQQQSQMQVSPGGGLGATAPAMEAPPEMPAPQQEVPGMAAGGLSNVPLPDAMFDEPTNGGFNDGYAGGGLVAFGSGGAAYEDFARVIPMQESGGRYTARNKSSGALGKYQLMPATARALAQRLGLGYNEALLTADTAAARQYQDALGQAAMQEAWDASGGDVATAAKYYHGGSNQKIWGPKTRQYADDILGRLGASPQLQDIDVFNRDERQRIGVLDAQDLAQSLYGDLPHKYRDEMRALLESERGPEAAKQRKKEDLWEAVGQFGAALATSPGDFLTGLSGAVAKTLPEVTASAKERKGYERGLVKDLMALEDLERKEATDVIKLGKDLWAADISTEEREAELQARIQEARDNRVFEAQQLDKKIAADLSLAAAQASSGAGSKDERFLNMFLQRRYRQLKQTVDAGQKVYTLDGKVAAARNPDGTLSTALSDTALRDLAMDYALKDLQGMSGAGGASFIPGMGGGVSGAGAAAPASVPSGYTYLGTEE